MPGFEQQHHQHTPSDSGSVESPTFPGSPWPGLSDASSLASSYQSSLDTSWNYEMAKCPHSECTGRRFKDLPAHMLTHQTERPFKCPIVACEYHSKGFAKR